MANGAIMTADLASAGTFSAGSQVVSLPAANLGTAALAQVWRSNGSNSTNVQVDLGTALACGAIALLFCNLTAAATFRVRTSNNSNMSSPDIDSGTIGVSGYLNTTTRQLVYPFAAASTRRYIRIDLADATLVYIEAGKLVAGPVSQPGKNYAHGWRWGAVDPSASGTSIGGQDWAALRRIKRKVDVTFPALTDAEARGYAYDVETAIGQARPVLFMLDTASSDRGRDSIWGCNRAGSGVGFPHPGIRDHSLSLIEWF